MPAGWAEHQARATVDFSFEPGHRLDAGRGVDLRVRRVGA
jgi:hypothetical protein